MYSLNLLHPKILVNSLHTVPWTFPMVLLKDNFCNNHFKIFRWRSFPLSILMTFLGNILFRSDAAVRENKVLYSCPWQSKGSLIFSNFL